MRLRHIPGCEEFIASSEDCISGERVSAYKGRWDELFGKKAKLYIEWERVSLFGEWLIETEKSTLLALSDMRAF